MRLPAALLALGLLAACSSWRAPDPAEVAVLDRDIAALGSIAKASGKRSPADIRSVTACVTSAQLRLKALVAGVGT